MKLSTKEAVLCVGGGVLISVVIFVIAFLIQPTIITQRIFWLPAGLLPMVLTAGIYMNRKEAHESEKFNYKK